MTSDFDPRPWNLMAGLALVTGCGARAISVDGDSVNDGETQDSESGAESGPGCVDTTDCPPGYYCYDGSCEYAPTSDGIMQYDECYSDSDCAPLELCQFNYCEYVYTPPACGLAIPQLPVIELPEQVLALAFVDVDDDGARELVAATTTMLHVFESGSPMPISHPRGTESNIFAMVGGGFDDTPGEDVLISSGGDLDLHASDGLGNLAPAVPFPGPYLSMRGLAAGSFDAEPSADLLAWGLDAAGVQYGGGGETLTLSGDPVESVTARDLGLPGSGFSLLHDNELVFMDLGGLTIGSALLYGSAPYQQASFDTGGMPLEIGTSTLQQQLPWSLIEVYDRLTSNQIRRWRLSGSLNHLRAGDLDGIDGSDELALVVDDTLRLYIGDECLLDVSFVYPEPTDQEVVDVAFGDHDGDGDDELAVHLGPNFVALVDVE